MRSLREPTSLCPATPWLFGFVRLIQIQLCEELGKSSGVPVAVGRQCSLRSRKLERLTQRCGADY